MSTIDEIKSRLDIVEVIGGYIHLQKAGRNYKALCPFHGEKTPSFVVYPDNQSWRCFGQCGEGGDVFSFIMKQEGKSFGEVLRELAERTGVILESQKSDERLQEDKYLQLLLGILKEAAHFYQSCLPGSPSEAYIHKRGLSPKTLANFGLGHAPNEWNALLRHLEALGYARADLLAAGVVVEHQENKRLFDRFRDRFIIPIRDQQGRVIGFGARALSDDRQPKYLNSPQSKLFDKSHILFGFDQARRAIRESETAIIVEGYLDVMQAHQAGYQNVVASMGTALTKEHLQTLGKYVNKLILALDADEAGMKATLRGLEVAREELSTNDVHVMDVDGVLRQAGRMKVDIRILNLPHGKDPDDFLRQSPEAWPEVVAAAKPLALYLIDRAVSRLPPNASVMDRERLALEMLPLMIATEDDLVRMDNLQNLSLKLRLDPKLMFTWASRNQRQFRPPGPQTKGGRPNLSTAPSPARAFSPTTENRNLERYCLAALIESPQRLFDANRVLREMAETSQETLYRGLEAQDFAYPAYQAIFLQLQLACRQIELDPSEYFYEQLDPTLLALVEQDVLVPPVEKHLLFVPPPKELPVSDAEFFRYLIKLRLKRLERESSELFFILQEAQNENQRELVETYRLAYNETTKALGKVQSAFHKL